MNNRKAITLGLVAVLFFCVLLLPPAECYAVTVEAGDRAPLFDAQTLDGEKFVLKEHLGKNVVLLNFWSVFCRDCISRIEALNKINDLFSQRDFELVGIAALNDGGYRGLWRLLLRGRRVCSS